MQEASRIRCWLKEPLSLRAMSSLRTSDFNAYRDARLAQGAKQSTVRSELSIVSTVFRLAPAAWDMDGLDNPLRLMEWPKPDDKRERRVKTASMSLDGAPVKPVSELEAIKHYTESVELPALIDIAVETTMRRGEHTAVRRAHVDLEHRIIRLTDAKNGSGRFVLLSRVALERLADHLKGSSGVMLFKMRPDSITQAFARAQARARAAYLVQCEADPALEVDDEFLVGLRFHDLRHEGASIHAHRAGMTTMRLMAITGHKSLRSLDRYLHMEAASIARTLD